jgi:poly(3-hydroxybutyrate) depolymerase
MQLRFLFILLSVCSALTACKKQEDTQPTTPAQTSVLCTDNRFSNVEYFAASDIQSSLDISYGNATNWEGNNENLKMDAYFPDVAKDSMSSRPTIMLIHGGGFVSGDKAQLTTTCLEFAKRGFVVFNINYRLGWDNSLSLGQTRAIYRAQQDALAALRYIVNNAATYGVDTDQLFIGGGSAGAVTSLNVVYASQSEWNTLVPSLERDLGSLNTSGNTLTNTFALKGVFNNWGSVFEAVIDTNEMLPMVAFHGALDTTVPIDKGDKGSLGSREIYKALTANGVCADLTVQLDGGHGIYLGTDGTAFRVKRAACFFKSIMCNTCSSFTANERVEPDCVQ